MSPGRGQRRRGETGGGEPLRLALDAFFAPKPDASAPARRSPLDASLPPDAFLRSPPIAVAAPSPATLPGLGRVRAPGEGEGRRALGTPARSGAGELPGVGSILDKYRIEEVVGTGGFAVVYRATHLLLEASVAIKLLRPAVVARRPDLAELLCKEARFAARIDHRNVVRIYDATRAEGITYIVMEYIHGVSLARRIRSERLSPVETLSVAIGVASGLRAALHKGLIHRDIKPANILLARGGEVKIVDLGLAQPRVPDAAAAPAEPGPHAGWVGTPGYMAPEQARDPHNLDFRADIYSLGATLYHASVGAPPFPLEDRASCIAMHGSTPVTPPHQREPRVPRVVGDLIMWMLEKDPARRPATYEALLDRLRRCEVELRRDALK